MKILAFPYSENPYQDLLYEQTTFNSDEIKYLKYDLYAEDFINRFFVFWSILKFRTNGYTIFHLHWLYNFAPQNSSKLQLYLNTIYIPLLLFFIKSVGFKLVWTVHNIVPHEKTSLNDKQIVNLLFRISDGIIVHSQTTLEELHQESYKSKKVHIVPMGNVIQMHSPTGISQILKKQNHIPTRAFVFLFFGLIRPYKGVENLIYCFNKLQKSNPDIHLLIVGSFVEVAYKKNFTRISSNPMIKNAHYILHSVSDSQLADYISISDIAVFPFTRVTTSSSALHALAAKKPIIAPRIGALRDLPRECGYFYNPEDTDGLYHEMLNAYKNRTRNKRKGEQGYVFVSKNTWEDAAIKTRMIYRTC
jgi:beta-1,4-mannosyltransferase